MMFRARLFSKSSLAQFQEFCDSSICLYEIKKKNLSKSTCPTGSFTCPGPSGSEKGRALDVNLLNNHKLNSGYANHDVSALTGDIDYTMAVLIMMLMRHSTTICKLVDLIPALRQSDCRIPNWVNAKTVLSSSTNHGQTTARFRSFFR